MTKMQKSIAVAAVLLTVLTSQTSANAAALDTAVDEVVTKLCRYLKSKGETQISIGQFVGPPQIAATSGPGIAKVFHTCFEKNKIAVVTRCNVGLKGEYSLAKLPGDGVGVKISGSLVDAFGDVLTDFTFDADGGKKNKPGHIEKVVDKQEDVAELLGATTELHPDDLPGDRQRDLKKQVLDPKLHVEGTKCSPSAKSPYHIEVLVHGHPTPIDVIDGLGFVKIDRGQIYSVKIYNESEYDAAVRLSIDGLNIFTFSKLRKPDGEPKYSFYIVPARKVVELKGWHRDNSTVDSFRVTSYADSAAATLNHKQDLGTITAVFAAAWPRGGTRPHDEDFVGKGAPNATGFGPPVTQVVQEVQRDVGKMRASISLRYSR